MSHKKVRIASIAILTTWLPFNSKNLKLDHDMENNHFGSLSVVLFALKQSASLWKLAKIDQKYGINFGTLSLNSTVKMCEFSLFIPLLKFDRQTLSSRKIGILESTSAPCINYMQYPWRYAVPVRICITCKSYHQYPWVISSVPVRVCITRESYPQYLWGYAVPVSHILSTRKDMQYLWGCAVPVREVSFILHSYKFTHGYCISSRVLRIWLTGTEDMTHG